MVETPDFLKDPVSRRTFLARMSAAGLGTAAAVLLAGCGGSDSSKPNNGGDATNFPGIPGQNENVVVLNYALTLETLEADLYRQALLIAAGKDPATTLPTDPTAFAQAVSGYTQVVGNGTLDPTLAGIGFLYLKQYAAVEAAHREFLKAAIPTIGGTPVPPNPKGYTTGLATGADLKTILSLIRTVEETGVTAYLGAAGFLTDTGLVQIASSIYTTEARHSAGVNYILGLPTGPTGDVGGTQPATGVSKDEFEFAQSPSAVLAGVKPFFL